MFDLRFFKKIGPLLLLLHYLLNEILSCSVEYLAYKYLTLNVSTILFISEGGGPNGSPKIRQCLWLPLQQLFHKCFAYLRKFSSLQLDTVFCQYFTWHQLDSS